MKKKNEEFENQYTHEEKSGSSQKERNKKQFTHFIVLFNALYNMKKIKNNPKNEEGKSICMLYVWRVTKKTPCV